MFGDSLSAYILGAGLWNDHVLGGQCGRPAKGAVRVPFDCGRQTGRAVQLQPGQPDVRFAGGGLLGG